MGPDANRVKVPGNDIGGYIDPSYSANPVDKTVSAKFATNSSWFSEKSCASRSLKHRLQIRAAGSLLCGANLVHGHQQMACRWMFRILRVGEPPRSWY